MNEATDTGSRLAQPWRAHRRRRAGLKERWARRILLGRLAELQHGELVFRDGEQEDRFGRPIDGEEPAVIEVLDPALYPAAVLGGSVGAGRAYLDGYWASPHLTAVIQVLVRNEKFLQKWRGGIARATSPIRSIRRLLSRNTLAGSRRNIEAHYDLSNDFFSLFLDERMMYSSAWFANDDMDLDQASAAKLDRICQRLRLGPDDHVVEIGTGWGGFALHAAREYGCRVTTTTISAEQFRHAKQRVAEAGLGDRVTVLDRDYRLLDGQYDALVSIEMIEAVGADFLDVFFAKCSSLLRPDGRMMIQAITIGDDEFERAAQSVDFIQEYIFPGSCLPSLRRMSEAVRTMTDLRPGPAFDLRSSYAETLSRWREQFLVRLPEVSKLGFDERFARMWEFYLCYCEGGFRESRIGVFQLEFTKPGHARIAGS
jgi:cyclopropane-fatty-acyl-phospholipid synthase